MFIYNLKLSNFRILNLIWLSIPNNTYNQYTLLINFVVGTFKVQKF